MRISLDEKSAKSWGDILQKKKPNVNLMVEHEEKLTNLDT